jgi:hypothetical protein
VHEWARRSGTSLSRPTAPSVAAGSGKCSRIIPKGKLTTWRSWPFGSIAKSAQIDSHLAVHFP